MFSEGLCVTQMYIPSSSNVTLKRCRVPEIFFWLPPPYSPWTCEQHSLKHTVSIHLAWVKRYKRNLSYREVVSGALLISCSNPLNWSVQSCSSAHLNVSPFCDQCPIFEPGDARWRWTFPWHTLEENSLSFSDCLVLGTEENILQTWNTQHKRKWTMNYSVGTMHV